MENERDTLSGNEKYISLKEASDASGYAKDYIGYLCRTQKVAAKRFGRDWFVNESALISYKLGDETARKDIKNIVSENIASGLAVGGRDFMGRVFVRRAIIISVIVTLLGGLFAANDIMTSRKLATTESTTPKISPAEQLVLQKGAATSSPASSTKWDITSSDLISLKSFIIAELSDKGLVVNTIVEKPTIVERAVERIISGISQEDLDAQLNIINNKLLSQVADLKNLIASRSDQNFSAIALTNKIDVLNGTSLSNV
ncbi:MAG: hypothetical protein HZA25_01075, partial [Candidatus Niyogibacteria bacterium]|nr:hypothetical protein [Candidatus Niyogibacteria bacterium]